MLLGLDVSSKATGVAFTVGAHVSASACFQSDSKDSLIRAVDQHVALDHMLRGALPSFAVIESYAFKARGRSKHMLYEAGTMIRYTLLGRGVPWIEVNPMHLKQFATGMGRANKDDMRAAAFELLGFATDDHNIADAALLALAGHCISYLHAGEKPLIPRALSPTQVTVLTKYFQEYEDKVLRD